MNKNRCTIVLNGIIAISTLVIATIGIFGGAGAGQVGSGVVGWGYFKPYTMDSNILTGIVAIMILVCCFSQIHSDRIRPPKWLMNAYLMGTTSLLLTFLVAAFFLAPMEQMKHGNYFVMFSDDMFFFHFLNPLLSAVSLTLLLDGETFRLTDCFIGMLPTFLYSVVYFVMVVILEKWSDFYGFTFGGQYALIPIVLVIIFGISFLISFALTKLHNCVTRERKSV